MRGSLLSPDAELLVDDYATRLGAGETTHNGRAIEERFIRHSNTPELVLVNGTTALAAFSPGKARIVFSFTIENRKVVRVEMIADPARLSGLEIARVEG